MNVGKTLLSSKDPKARDTFRQVRNANDQMFMENALGVTARGKAGSRFKNTIGLDDRYSKLNREREFYLEKVLPMVLLIKLAVVLILMMVI